MKPQQPLTHALIAQKQPQFAALNTNKRTSTASSASSSSDTIVQVHHNEQFFKQHQVHLQKLKPKDDSAQIRAHDAQQKRMKKKDINKHSYKGSNRVMKENVDSGIKHKPVEGKIGSIQLIQKTKKQLDYKVKNQVFSSRDEQVESVHTNEDDNHERIVVQLITNNKVSQNQYYSHSSFDSRTLKVNTRQTSKDRTQLSIERMQQNFVNPSFSNPFLNSFDKKSEQGFITSNKPSLNSTLASQHPSIVPPRKTLKCSSISECLQVNQHQRHSSSNLNSYASNVSHKVMSPTTTVIEMPLEKILHQSMEESLEDARFPQSYNAKHLSANSSTLTKESIKTYFVKVTNNKPEMVKQPLTKLRKSELKSIEKKIKDLGRVIKGHQYSKQSSASKIFANQKLTRKNSELVLQNMNPYQLAANLNSMIISKQKRQSHQQYSQTNNLQALTQSQESLHNVPSKHTKIQPAMTSFIQDQQLHQPQHIQIVLDINKHKKHMSTSLDDQQIFEQLPQPHISPRFTKTNLHFKDSLLHQATKPSRFTLNSLNQSLRQTSNSPHQSRNFQKSSICMAGSIVSASLNLQKIEGSFKDMVANSSRMQHLTQTMNNNKAKQNMSVTKRHESSRGSSVKQQTQGRNTVGGTSLYTKNMTGTQLNFKSERTSTRALNQCEPSLKEATYERVQEVDQEYDSSRILNDKQPGTCALVQKCLSSCKSPAQFKKSLHYNQPKLIKRDRSYLIKVLFHVTKFFGIDALIRLAHCSKKFTKIREIKFIINSQFRTLIVRGLSTFDRAKYWNYRTRFVYYRRKYKNLYNKIIVEKKSEYQSDISKDLDRTFPQLKHFTKGNLGQDQLERLLTAISIYYKKLGYVQGMNFIVGTVMLNFQVEEVLQYIHCVGCILDDHIYAGQLQVRSVAHI